MPPEDYGRPPGRVEFIEGIAGERGKKAQRLSPDPPMRWLTISGPIALF
jgi:hypothetical protein